MTDNLSQLRSEEAARQEELELIRKDIENIGQSIISISGKSSDFIRIGDRDIRKTEHVNNLTLRRDQAERRYNLAKSDLDDVRQKIRRAEEEELEAERQRSLERDRLIQERERQAEENDRLLERERTQAAEHAKLEQENRIHWSRRFTTSLAIGNGAAFAAIANHVFDKDADRATIVVAFPAIFLFALGVMAAGTIPLMITLGWKRLEIVATWFSGASFALGMLAGLTGMALKAFSPLFLLWLVGK